MDDIKNTITFGLRHKDISTIEAKIASVGTDMFSYHLWVEIGKLISWEPLTALCFYMRYLQKAPNTDDVYVIRKNKYGIGNDGSQIIAVSFNSLSLENHLNGLGLAKDTSTPNSEKNPLWLDGDKFEWYRIDKLPAEFIN